MARIDKLIPLLIEGSFYPCRLRRALASKGHGFAAVSTVSAALQRQSRTPQKRQIIEKIAVAKLQEVPKQFASSEQSSVQRLALASTFLSSVPFRGPRSVLAVQQTLPQGQVPVQVARQESSQSQS